MKFSKKFTIPQAGFQLAPLIDVVFLLLIFFIVTWSFARFETEMNINVPVTEEGEEPRRTPGEIIVNLRSDGAMIVNGNEKSEKELGELLSKISKFRRGQPVILRGDKEASYDKVIKVMAVCHKSNIYNIAFSVMPKQNTKP